MRRSNFKRKSSLVGQQQRADARTEAHRKTLATDRTINVLGYRMPDPGPNTAQKKTKPPKFAGKTLQEQKQVAKNYLLMVGKGTQPIGLKACAAMDFLAEG